MSNINNINQLAQVFGALSNPNRLRIFMNLVSCCSPGTSCAADAKCVGDLSQDSDISPSTVSHHLKELHRAGLIHMERKGQRVECWAKPETMDEITRFFTRLRGT